MYTMPLLHTDDKLSKKKTKRKKYNYISGCSSSFFTTKTKNDHNTNQVTGLKILTPAFTIEHRSPKYLQNPPKP